VSLIAFGSFPYVAVALSLSFAVYGLLKKKAGTDPIAGITTESLITAPVALIIIFIMLPVDARAVSVTEMLLLAGGGALTALPLVLYSRSINSIPFIVVGFLQYISPTLSMIYALISGETPSASQLVSFIFIGLGLIVFSIALILLQKREAKS